LIEKWLKSGIFFQFVFYETEEGTPQGSVISPLLCNITLHGLPLELGIREQADGRVHEYYSGGRTMLRYADDFVIFCKTKANALALYDELEPLLAKRGLDLNRAKSNVSSVTAGFDFLGFTHRLAKKFGKSYSHTESVRPDGEFDFIRNDKLTPSSVPSKKSYRKVKQALSDLFAEYAGKSPTQLVLRANRVIRGWCLSKRAFDCFGHFKDLDNFLFKKQLRYIKRRHPNKSAAWRVPKYFALERDPRRGYFYKWTFRDPSTGVAMLRAFWFWRRQIPGGKVIAYSPVKLDQVPDNPDSREYFHNRNIMLLSRGYADLTKKFDITLAQKQNWCCPVCSLSFGNNLGEPIHRHHIIERRLGGKDTPSNLILVHWPCHMKIHHDRNKCYWTDFLFAVKRSRGLISLQLPEKPLDPEAGDIED
jgi:RNA-directed DNA polymerase